MKSAVCAVQAEAAAVFDAVRRSEPAAAGVPGHRQGRGIAAEVALARKEAPARGQVLLGLGKVLAGELVHTLSGRVKRLAAELDPAALAKRARQAEADRKVTVRPAPDTMTYLTALLPVAQGVGVFACLGVAADRMRAAGDPRSKAQLMADLLVARITGQDLDTTTEPPAVLVAVNITVPATTLAGGHDAAILDAPGVAPETLPAEVARLLLADALDAGVAAWFRQVYLNHQGRLIGMSSKQRHFPPGLADFLAIRGQGICASPWCDAPVRHADHIQPASDRGPTTDANGQGLCEACNRTKQADGWQQHVVSAENDRQAWRPSPPPVTATKQPHRHQSAGKNPPDGSAPVRSPLPSRGTVEGVSTADPTSQESLESLLLELLHQRRAGATICPSDAARAAASGPAEEEWRSLMEPVRQAASNLVRQGRVEITQGGEVVDLSSARGPVRIRLTGRPQ